MRSSELPVYLDCAATTPLEPRVKDVVVRYLAEDYGNSGSRTHAFGTSAKQAVEAARKQVADVCAASPDEVVFTSGATESNNLAILGLAAYGCREGRKHIVSSRIEHKAVLDPLLQLEKTGFEVSLVGTDSSGRLDPDAVLAQVRDDTLLVSVMHVNNETGVVQPVGEIADGLADHPCYMHTDAAQGYGKDFSCLRHDRIDLLSISGHKIYAPKGVGALIARRRELRRPPLHPLMFGGGQEMGLRPGTLPVALIAGLGRAAQLAVEEAAIRTRRNQTFKQDILRVFKAIGAKLHGDQEHVLPNMVNLSIPSLDSEAVMLSVKGLIAISNGSACTASSFKPSHVLTAMGLPPEQVGGALRLSWCHMTPQVDWPAVLEVLRKMF